MTDPSQVQAAVADALSAALADQGEMVTGWVAHIETIDTDGDRALWHVTPEDTTKWDVLGMLEHCKYREYTGPD